MCCHIRSASVSQHRQIKLRSAPTLPLLSMLDLSKPGELKAHEFLLRSTSKSDPMWRLLDVRRNEATLLCVVKWVLPAKKTKPFALAEVSLTEMAVSWRDYATADAARTEMEQRGGAIKMRDKVD